LFYTYALQVQWSGFQISNDFKVLLSVVNAPDWARPPGANLELEGPPADPATLASFLRAFVVQVKPEMIDAIEIWNEPNLLREWDGLPIEGGIYMSYFRAAYEAVKSVAPHATLVTAGLAPVGDIPGSAASDRRFLQEMYDAGLAQYSDVKIGVHPYGWANPPDERCCTTVRGWADNPVFFFLDTLYDYTAIIQQNGHTGGKIWVTEFGWGSYDGLAPGAGAPAAPPAAPFFAMINERQQAEYIVRAFELMQQPPLGDMIEVAFLWNLNFSLVGDPIAGQREDAGYSLLNVNAQPRLVYYYLESARRP
jgi:hypothetical protein